MLTLYFVDEAALFAQLIARTAKDIDILIDSLPSEDSSPELQVSSQLIAFSHSAFCTRAAVDKISTDIVHHMQRRQSIYNIVGSTEMERFEGPKSKARRAGSMGFFWKGMLPSPPVRGSWGAV